MFLIILFVQRSVENRRNGLYAVVMEILVGLKFVCNIMAIGYWSNPYPSSL